MIWKGSGPVLEFLICLTLEALQSFASFFIKRKEVTPHVWTTSIHYNDFEDINVDAGGLVIGGP